jgi:hypothetical protein
LFCLPPANLLLCCQSLIATILSFSLSAPSSWTLYSRLFFVSLISSQFPSHILFSFIMPLIYWLWTSGSFRFTLHSCSCLLKCVRIRSNLACSDGGPGFITTALLLLLSLLSLNLLMSYIYMELLVKPEILTSYVYGFTSGNAESRLFLFAAQCFNSE